MFATIASFRGAWYLLDTYWLPAQPLTSLLSSMVMAAALLAAFRIDIKIDNYINRYVDMQQIC